ncbi:DUF1960-domain-containing protein [Marasmius fiardii PR-910]|nr:DUF1960-domain-containing protein [Marasmius fiardii PR-910]
MRTLTKVIYKPDTQSTEEYTIIVNPEEVRPPRQLFSFAILTDFFGRIQYKKWKAGDTTIAIAEVVDSFSVFHSNQGAQGILGQASKQQLENTFGSSKDIDVVQKILESGKSQTGKISEKTFQTTAAKGSAVIDTRGKGGLTGI